MSTVRVGLLVPQYGASADDALDTARAADDAGLDIWVAGQLIAISQSVGKSALEPLTLMGAIAAVTTHARLGFMALASPYLPPFYLAKALLTLDNISGGRLDAGLGAGWREEEFDGLGVRFGKVSERLAQLEEALDALEELARGYSPDAVTRWPPTGPAAIQRPRPPVWIAGQGKRVLDVAARRGDWTNFARGISVDDFRSAGAAVAAAAAAAGRADRGPRLSLTGSFLTAPEDAFDELLFALAAQRGLDVGEYRRKLREANTFVGTPIEVAGQLQPYCDSGCEAAILWPLGGNPRQAAVGLGMAAGYLNGWAG